MYARPLIGGGNLTEVGMYSSKRGLRERPREQTPPAFRGKSGRDAWGGGSFEGADSWPDGEFAGIKFEVARQRWCARWCAMGRGRVYMRTRGRFDTLRAGGGDGVTLGPIRLAHGRQAQGRQRGRGDEVTRFSAPGAKPASGFLAFLRPQRVPKCSPISPSLSASPRPRVSLSPRLFKRLPQWQRLVDRSDRICQPDS
jgi:hypothetical protein